MIENLCEENHWQLTGSLQNLLCLKLLHDAGVNVKNFGSFTIRSDVEWERLYDIFLFGVTNLFDKAEQAEDEECDYMDGMAVDVKFNNLLDFYQQIPNAEEEMEKLIGEQQMIVHPNNKGFRIEVCDVMAEEITESLSFLIRFRKVVNERIKKKVGDEQWHRRSA